MKMVTKMLFLFAVLVIGISSCSKEKRIERQLEKKEGKWRIASLDYRYYVSNELQAAGTYANAGKIEFGKKGTFTMTISINGVPETSVGTWTNSKDEIAVMIDGTGSVLKISDGPKKGKLKLNQTEYSSATDEKEVYIFDLEREK